MTRLPLSTRMEPPLTLRRVHARHPWAMPFTAALFVLLAAGAAYGQLPWDRPITDAVVAARTSFTDTVALRVSFLGSTPVVLSVALAAAALAWRRSPRLAVAILVIAATRPLLEWAVKDLIARDRPVGARLVRGDGPSFPSGHPMAAAASWCLLPLVVELYAQKRAVWWATVIGTWTLAVCVGASRVWLGVHWASDVVGGLLLAVLGVAAAERIMHDTHSRRMGAARAPTHLSHPTPTRSEDEQTSASARRAGPESLARQPDP